MRELKPSGWGKVIDKSNAIETYPLRGDSFPNTPPPTNPSKNGNYSEPRNQAPDCSVKIV